MSSRSFERKRKAWLREAVARHEQEALLGKRATGGLTMHWLERGEWVVRRGDINVAWFRNRDDAVRYVGTHS